MNWALPSLFIAKSHSPSFHMIVCTQCAAAQRSHSNRARQCDKRPSSHFSRANLWDFSSLCEKFVRCGDFHIFLSSSVAQVPGCRTGQNTKVILPAFVNTQSQYDNRDQGKYKIYTHLGISVSLALIMRAIPWNKWPAQMSDTGNNIYYRTYFYTRMSIYP